MSGNASVLAHANLVCRLLSGCWRRSPPELACGPQELAEITPLLLSSGAAALAWYRVRTTTLNRLPAALELQQAYRHHAINGARYQRSIKQAFSLIRSAGIEPILVKGWAIAGLYPEHGLRPFGDLDLCVRQEDYERAQEAFQDHALPECPIDLHKAFSKLDFCDENELFERSGLVDLDEVKVRVLGLEDHLRLLCLHLLRHGAWRPLWLCDIGAAVEARPPDFDWNVCLTPNRRVADWVVCAIGLAHQLLGARIEDVPIVARAKSLPGWLVPAVLREWGRCHNNRIPTGLLLRRPLSLLRELPGHWPNSIEGTINMRAAFNGFPRFPFQLADSIRRAAMLLPRFPRARRQ